jgi:hypothetical protein
VTVDLVMLQKASERELVLIPGNLRHATASTIAGSSRAALGLGKWLISPKVLRHRVDFQLSFVKEGTMGVFLRTRHLGGVHPVDAIPTISAVRNALKWLPS